MAKLVRGANLGGILEREQVHDVVCLAPNVEHPDLQHELSRARVGHRERRLCPRHRPWNESPVDGKSRRGMA